MLRIAFLVTALLACTAATATGVAAAPRVAAAPGRIAVTFDESREMREHIGALVPRPDGSLLAVGATGRSARLAVMAFRPDGSLDAGFGAGGGAIAPFAVHEGVALLPSADGSLIAVGGQPSTDGSSQGAPAAVRVLPGGRFDPAYGGDGVGEVPGIVQVGCLGCALAALQPDGGVLVAGFGGRSPDRNRFTVTRLRPDGSADPASRRSRRGRSRWSARTARLRRPSPRAGRSSAPRSAASHCARSAGEAGCG
jgi:hypothetical protein